ncbi:MAG: hypothetical protein ACRD1X_04190, partial [Vicinamibacteria bacterium]
MEPKDSRYRRLYQANQEMFMTAEGNATKSGFRHRKSVTSNEDVPPRLEDLAADPTRVGALAPDAAMRLLAQCLSAQV